MEIFPEKPNGMTFRRVTKSDDNFIFETIKATMLDYVSQTYGPWNADQQHSIIEANTDYHAMRAITLREQDIGLVTVTREADCFKLSQSYVLPDHQGRGAGSVILSYLKQVAVEASLPLRLSVLASNPAAHRLYERVGFTTSEVTDIRTHMEYKVR